MKNKIKLIIAMVILLVLAGGYSIVDKTTNIYNAEYENSQFQQIEMKKGDSVAQTFVTKEKALDGMELKLTGSGNVDQIQVSYELANRNGEAVASDSTKLDKLKNGRFFEFKFDRIEVSNNEFTFTLKVDSCDDDSKLIVYTTPGKIHDGTLENNGEKVDGEWVLRTIAHRFDIETFVVTVIFLIYVVLFLRWLGKLFK